MQRERKVKENSLGGRKNLRKSAEKKKLSQIRVKLILLSAKVKNHCMGKTDGKSDVKIEGKIQRNYFANFELAKPKQTEICEMKDGKKPKQKQK